MTMAWFSSHYPILIGLCIGALAHFGKRIAEGDLPKFVEFLGYGMQLGLIGLACAMTINWLGVVDDTTKMTMAAMFAMSTNEVVQWLKRTQLVTYVLERVLMGKDGKTAEGDK